MLRDRLHIRISWVNPKAILYPKGTIGNIWGHFCLSVGGGEGSLLTSSGRDQGFCC